MAEGGIAEAVERPPHPRRADGGTVGSTGDGCQADTARSGEAGSGSTALLEAALCRDNLMEAYRRVVRNKGAAGIDGVTVDELWDHCKAHWPLIREQLLEGTYRPAPVRQVLIPKPGGGRRALGIPTVLDRLIQQAKLRVAPASVQRLKTRIRAELRRGRGRNLRRVLLTLKPVIRGWVAYYRLVDVKAAFEVLDQWLRRRLRCLLWRQWKHWRNRMRRLMEHGIERLRAWRSATNGRGPWWNAGASHMHAAIPARRLHHQGLVSFLGEYRRLAGTT